MDKDERVNSMKQPIIVSAFWDVGRAENCELPRSNERYYKEFEAWARIQNYLIIYTDKYSEERIRSIRKNYGLEEKTKIIVNDVFTLEESTFHKMCAAEANSSFVDFRYRPEAMENKAKFNYAWFMKYWCLADATQYASEDDVFAWFDFGFNHLDKCYSRMEEFDFLWTLNKEVKKVQIYSLKPVGNIEIIDVLQFMQDTVMGVFLLVPSSMAKEFWNTIREAMRSLLMIGCIDDDQVLMLMAAKWRPDLVDLNISEWWYMPLKENGANHLSVSINKQKPTLKHRIWAKKYIAVHMFGYLKKTYIRMKKSIDSVV